MQQDSALQSFGFESRLPEELQILLQEAMLHFYRGEWTEFDKLSEILQKNELTQARATFFLSLKQFWSLYFLPKSDYSINDFVETCEKAISLTAQDSDISEVEAVTVGSSLQGYLALICARDLRILDAAKYGLSAFSSAKKLRAFDARHPALLLSNGIYNYMFDKVPALARSLILGTNDSFSKDVGLLNLLDLARSQSLLAVDAALILCELNELSSSNAQKILEPLLERFPKNAILISEYQKVTKQKWVVEITGIDEQLRRLLS